MEDMIQSVCLRELRAFLDSEGRLKQMPAKHKKRLYVYLWAATLFEPDRLYTEGQVNALIGGMLAFDDPLQIRRALVDHGFLARKPDGSAYWLVQPQLALDALGLGG